MYLSSVSDRMKALPALAKAGIVAGGYVAAILFAACVVSIYISRTSGPDRQSYAAMFDFGDSLLFLAVFAAVSTIPTGLALVFLRQSRAFWVACSVAALAIASTALAAVAVPLLTTQGVMISACLNAWAGLAFPRIFVSPFLAASFGLSALVAPEARFRWLLFGAAGIEGVSSVYASFTGLPHCSSTKELNQ
jgi:hypothetical protein